MIKSMFAGYSSRNSTPTSSGIGTDDQPGTLERPGKKLLVTERDEDVITEVTEENVVINNDLSEMQHGEDEEEDRSLVSVANKQDYV